jgi:tRNA (cmo5U34)-methyltransferase
MSSRLPSTRPTTRRERIKRNEAIKHRDDIFLDKNSPTKFEFDSGVAEVFDDMLERSVPLYRECQNLTVNWCKRLATPDKYIYDLGCSTGSLLLLLTKSISTIPKVHLIGVDNSAAMINKARNKLSNFPDSVGFVKANLDDSFLFNDS